MLPRVHRVAALLKRWLDGTHQGAVQPDQLDYYLDEFTFRFNRRDSRARGLLFYRLLHQAVRTEPHPYDALVAGKPIRPAMAITTRKTSTQDVVRTVTKGIARAQRHRTRLTGFRRLFTVLVERPDVESPGRLPK